MNDSTLSVTWWLEMVKIARKGFEVLSKGEEQAMAWRPSNLARVKEYLHSVEVPIKLWWSHWNGGSNTLDELWKWLDAFEVNSHLLNGIKSHAQDGYAQEENQSWHVDTLTWWRLRVMVFGLKEINSSDSNSVFIWSWVNRYVLLLRWMHHVERYLFISAQANLCEVWVFESHKS